MIRQINESDFSNYFKFSKDFYTSTAVSHNVNSNNFVTTFKECLNNSPYCHGVMVECENNVVGYGLFSITYSNEAGGIVVWLEELYILEEYRSRGLGKEFFEYAYKKFGNDAKRFRLEVSPDNKRAIMLYDKLNYKFLNYQQMIIDKA